jgi:hypothetical protein
MEPAANPPADTKNDGVVTSHELMECAKLGNTQAYSNQTPVQFAPAIAVGGLADFPDVAEPAPGTTDPPGGSASPPVAAIAGITAAALALVAGGGWYARRRFRQRRV